ncbi:hypothetical protein B7463_g3980, partial [Scytalidium lignicola]
MLPFTLKLPDNCTVQWRASIPKVDPKKKRKFMSLIVCLPGGSYNSIYFDVNKDYSIATVASFLDIPVISINRPGYSGSTLAPNSSAQVTTAGPSQRKYLNLMILPAL